MIAYALFAIGLAVFLMWSDIRGAEESRARGCLYPVLLSVRSMFFEEATVYLKKDGFFEKELGGKQCFVKSIQMRKSDCVLGISLYPSTEKDIEFVQARCFLVDRKMGKVWVMDSSDPQTIWCAQQEDISLADIVADDFMTRIGAVMKEDKIGS